MIDERGITRSASDFDTHQYFGVRGSTEELLRYATRNLGFALLEARHEAAIIRIRPDNFSVQTYECLVAELDRIRPTPRRYILETLAPDGENFDLLPALEDVIARLGGLQARDRGPNVAFTADPADLGRARRSVATPISRSLAWWQRTGGRISRRALATALDRPLDAPVLLARLRPDGVPIVWTMPRYINFWADADRERLIGTAMTDHPDAAYAGNAAAGFQPCAQSGMPRFEVIDATIRPGNAPARHVYYERLLLPWTTSDGERLVSSASASRVERFISASTRMI